MEIKDIRINFIPKISKLIFRQRVILLLLTLSILNIVLIKNIKAVEKPRIVLSMQISHTKVPLNRTLELTVILKWSDDANRYEVIKFEEPILTNFKIVGSAVSSRSEANKGKTDFIKEYIYTLKPQSLGMGYIEGIVAKVRDNIDGNIERLETQRLSIEIIDPIPEGTKMTRIQLYVALGIIVILLAAVIAVLLYRSKKYRQKQEIISYVEPMEKKYLDELKSTINLQKPNLRGDFYALSRLVRRYLKEKFSISALELATDEVISLLPDTKISENHMNNIKKILVRSDEIKFSGNEGTYEELTQFYTLFESLLDNYYHEAEKERMKPVEIQEKK
jgi:hypothetical protein